MATRSLLDLARDAEHRFWPKVDKRGPDECWPWLAGADGDGYVYQPVDEVAKDEIATEIVQREMEREWRQLQERYGHFVEFIELVRGSLEAA